MLERRQSQFHHAQESHQGAWQGAQAGGERSQGGCASGLPLSVLQVVAYDQEPPAEGGGNRSRMRRGGYGQGVSPELVLSDLTLAENYLASVGGRKTLRIKWGLIFILLKDFRNAVFHEEPNEPGKRP